ncbi:MAG TPA: cyclase family protein [Phycicoccus sp.]|jgi:kynurenine formamidase|nr:cyclase family protein [Phycicoccus sp.]HQK30458.1 cyclase family protein [Phycicoccus sp.]HQY95441.1 cyclase family protein [Phycicoccus sp.]HRA43832.1 cyclase family protein [Phycicoccus sp.]
MTDLTALAAAIVDGGVEVVDLTSPLHSGTPILSLPPEMGQTQPFTLELISEYDDNGPAWYWNNFHTGEHTGTHFDAPIHWITGRDLDDVSQVPAQRLVGPAVVIDKTAEVEANADYLLDVDDIKGWEAEHGPLPKNAWVLFRTGWSSRGDDAAAFANADDMGPHTPGATAAAAEYLAASDILGWGVETVGTDAGQAFGFEPAFPCHTMTLGANKYGITQLRNLDKLPVTGAIVIAAPLPIVKGSGSPCRVLALVAR